jgi:hypothetical protein
MIKTLFATLALLASGAHAATVVDTGTPDGQALFGFALDGNDWVAAQVTFTQDSTVDAVLGHILGGDAGDTFDVSLFAAGVAPRGTPLYTQTATFGADGWNGVSGLSGWKVTAGDYWIEFEIQGDDSSNGTSVFDIGASHPVATTAFTSDGGFSYADDPISFGLRVDATAVSAVPEPGSVALMLAGIALLSTPGFVRRRR